MQTRTFQSLICKYIFKVKLIISEWTTTVAKIFSYQVWAIPVKFLPLASSVFSLVLPMPCNELLREWPESRAESTLLFSTFHIFQSAFKDSKDLTSKLPLKRVHSSGVVFSIFEHVFCTWCVFSNNSSPEASVTGDRWQSKPELYIPSIGLQAYWFKNTLP